MRSCLSFIFSTAFLAAALTGCGGGSGSTLDFVPGAINTVTAVAGPDRFLLFPNPIVSPNGVLETSSLAYARAYYAAIDPENKKDTLAKWKIANGFGEPAGSLGEVTATFGDMLDLGYGRKMRGRQNQDGSIAFMVENFQADTPAGYGFSTFNLEAAAYESRRWHVGTSAIEYSPGPEGNVNFVKFYNFDPVTGQRLFEANLDGRGMKAMPAICANCHGGRADPLTPLDATTGQPLFARVANSRSQARGDLMGRLHLLKPSDFAYLSAPGLSRAEQEESIKTLNKMILCSYPRTGPVAGPEDLCRPSADLAPNEWQGDASAILKAGYGGNGLPSTKFNDTYVPSSWASAGQTALYTNVVKPACATCHSLRGTGNQADVSLSSYAAFQAYADRTRYHVFDNGNMPLARIVWDDFWNKGLADQLGSWLGSQQAKLAVNDSAGNTLKPGRPVADPGPDRWTTVGDTPLSAAQSLYSNSYKWAIVSNPGNAASISNPASVAPTFNATATGTYQLILGTSQGSILSSPARLTIVVGTQSGVAPAALRFDNPVAATDIKRVLQAGAGACVGCHRAPAAGASSPPIYFTDIDRNGDGTINATDSQWLYAEVRGRINFTDVGASPLLRKPAGHHHGGGAAPGYLDTAAPGNANRTDYDLILNWILAGAPY